MANKPRDDQKQPHQQQSDMGKGTFDQNEKGRNPNQQQQDRDLGKNASESSDIERDRQQPKDIDDVNKE